MKRLRISSILAALALAGPAWGAACNIGGGQVFFGAYDVFDPLPRDSTGSVTLTCHTPFMQTLRVGIGPSAGSGTIARRAMIGAIDQLEYNLFVDAARTQVWGDDTAGASAVSVAGVSRDTPQRITIYGRIPVRQNVTVGPYSDNLLISILP